MLSTSSTTSTTPLSYICNLSAALTDFATKMPPSLNDLPFLVSFARKYVFEHDGYIYRLESPPLAYARILFCKYAHSQNITDFYPEEITDLSTQYYLITKQQKLEPYTLRDNPLTQFSKPTREFIDKHHIISVRKENVGYDAAGRLRIFDWIANLATSYSADQSTITLIDANGNSLGSMETLNDK